MASKAIPTNDKALLAAQAKAGPAGVEAYQAARSELERSQTRAVEHAAQAAQARGGPAAANQSAMTQAQEVYQGRIDSLRQSEANAAASAAARAARNTDYSNAVQGARTLLKDEAALAAAPIRARGEANVNQIRQQGEAAVDSIRWGMQADKAKFEAEMRAAQQAAELEQARWEREMEQRERLARMARASSGGGGSTKSKSIDKSELAAMLQGAGTNRLQEAAAAITELLPNTQEVQAVKNAALNFAAFDMQTGKKEVPKPTKPTNDIPAMYRGRAWDAYNKQMDEYKADQAARAAQEKEMEKYKSNIGAAFTQAGLGDVEYGDTARFLMDPRVDWLLPAIQAQGFSPNDANAPFVQAALNAGIPIRTGSQVEAALGLGMPTAPEYNPNWVIPAHRNAVGDMVPEKDNRNAAAYNQWLREGGGADTTWSQDAFDMAQRQVMPDLAEQLIAQGYDIDTINLGTALAESKGRSALDYLYQGAPGVGQSSIGNYLDEVRTEFGDAARQATDDRWSEYTKQQQVQNDIYSAEDRTRAAIERDTAAGQAKFEAEDSAAEEQAAIDVAALMGTGQIDPATIGLNRPTEVLRELNKKPNIADELPAFADNVDGVKQGMSLAQIVEKAKQQFSHYADSELPGELNAAGIGPNPVTTIDGSGQRRTSYAQAIIWNALLHDALPGYNPMNVGGQNYQSLYGG